MNKVKFTNRWIRWEMKAFNETSNFRQISVLNGCMNGKTNDGRLFLRHSTNSSHKKFSIYVKFLKLLHDRWNRAYTPLCVVRYNVRWNIITSLKNSCHVVSNLLFLMLRTGYKVLLLHFDSLNKLPTFSVLGLAIACFAYVPYPELFSMERFMTGR